MSSTHRWALMGLLTVSSILAGVGCASAEEGTTGDDQNITNDEPEMATDRSYERRESIHFSEGNFDRTVLDPATGVIKGAHPEKFIVESGNVFSAHYASGEKGDKCGTVDLAADTVDFDGCDLAESYDISADGDDSHFERRERIDFTREGFTRTLLDPRTGKIKTARPEKFVVDGDVVYSAHYATGERGEACGRIVLERDAITFSGCGLWSSYDAVQ